MFHKPILKRTLKKWTGEGLESGYELGLVLGLERSPSNKASRASLVVVSSKLIIEQDLQIPLVILPVVGTHQPTRGSPVDSPSMVVTNSSSDCNPSI
jgi:hypothetical protein